MSRSPLPDLKAQPFFVQETARLKLETLTLDNMSGDYFDWLRDPEVLRYLEVRHAPAQTPERIRAFVRDMLISPDNLLMGIFTKSDEKHIGNIKLGPLNRAHFRADIGIIIGDKDSWGKNYATEAIQGISVLAFETLGLLRVQAGAYENNHASIRAFEKAGFEKEGVLRGYWLDDEGVAQDGILMGKLANE
ncbi:MAG: GNAT family N-acetyltransferase [Alphaproteobacteria bacterium]|nr:GNAT family N-acetyltransferase [Alphaproteobacteria bacterium]